LPLNKTKMKYIIFEATDWSQHVKADCTGSDWCRHLRVCGVHKNATRCGNLCAKLNTSTTKSFVWTDTETFVNIKKNMPYNIEKVLSKRRQRCGAKKGVVGQRLGQQKCRYCKKMYVVSEINQGIVCDMCMPVIRRLIKWKNKKGKKKESQ